MPAIQCRRSVGAKTTFIVKEAFDDKELPKLQLKAASMMIGFVSGC